jgi:hypothetical protein
MLNVRDTWLSIASISPGLRKEDHTLELLSARIVDCMSLLREDSTEAEMHAVNGLLALNAAHVNDVRMRGCFQ